MYKTFDINTKIEEEQKTIEILPSSFMGMVIGAQGSGKTHLIETMLLENELLGKKFKMCLWFTPNSAPSRLNIPEKNIFSTLEISTLEERLINAQDNAKSFISSKKLEESYKFNILIVFDDLVVSLKALEHNKQFLDILVRRRHIYKNLDISFIMVS